MSLIKHELYCLNNPNHKSRDIFKQNAINTNKIQTKRKIQNSQKQEYKFICKNCGKEYSLFLTENEFNKGKYTKYCSKSCSNRRILTKEIKENNKASLLGIEFNVLAPIESKPNPQMIKKEEANNEILPSHPQVEEKKVVSIDDLMSAFKIDDIPKPTTEAIVNNQPKEESNIVNMNL